VAARRHQQNLSRCDGVQSEDVRPLLAALLPLAAIARPVSADDGLHGQRALGDLTVEYCLAPGVYHPTAVELRFTPATGGALRLGCTPTGLSLRAGV
jgi:hypothetical protein